MWNGFAVYSLFASFQVWPMCCWVSISKDSMFLLTQNKLVPLHFQWGTNEIKHPIDQIRSFDNINIWQLVAWFVLECSNLFYWILLNFLLPNITVQCLSYFEMHIEYCHISYCNIKNYHIYLGKCKSPLYVLYWNWALKFTISSLDVYIQSVSKEMPF